MKDHRTSRRRFTWSHLLTTLLIIAVLALLQGCGGGGSGSGGSSFGGGDGSSLASTSGTGSTPTTTTNPDSTTNPITPATTPGTGAFKITLLLPGSDKAERVIPYHYKKLKTSFTCEAGTVADDVYTIPDGSTTVSRTITGIPVGLNTATIQILTNSDEVLAQRKQGFYMTSGGTASAGSVATPLSMGVAVINNLCTPAKIDVPVNTILFFENRDAVDREVQAGAKTTGTILAVNNGSQPITPATYDAKSITFDAAATYQFGNGFGGDGTANYRVIVFANPTVVSIKDQAGAGDNYSADNNEETVSFVITGTGFGDNQTMVDGTVTFIDVKPVGATTDYAANVTAWTDTQITGTITLPKSTGGTGTLAAGGGKYRLQISVRGTNTTENVYYYKGTGSYDITVN